MSEKRRPRFVRITSVPRSGHENSGLLATRFADQFNDEVWAIPDAGDYIHESNQFYTSILDGPWLRSFLSLRFIRYCFLFEVFAKALVTTNTIFLVHSFAFAAPLFLLRKPYYIFIHGSDRRHLSRFWARPIARRAKGIFGIGFEESGNGYVVEKVQNVFQPARLSGAPAEQSYDLLFVLRNSVVKNPFYPIDLGFALAGERIAIGVIGVAEDEVSESDRDRIVSLKSQSVDIRYLGRLPYTEVVAAMASSRALMIPSLSEGIPKVMLEALSLGVQVIVNCAIEVPDELRSCVESVELADWSRILDIVREEDQPVRANIRKARVASYVRNSEEGLFAVHQRIYGDL